MKKQTKDVLPMTMEELMAKARAAAEFSYSPYSKFRVGAALLCRNGKVITGTNIENRSFGLTVCAERNAIGTALGMGITEFEALAVSCPDADYAVSPCGACRQVISEFTADDFPIAFQGNKGEMIKRSMSEIFPDNALAELKD